MLNFVLNIKNMKINIHNRLVQQDLYELLNTHPDSLGSLIDGNKYYLVKTEMEDGEWVTKTLYEYKSDWALLEDLKTLKTIINDI